MSCNHTEQAPRVVEAPIVINRRWPEEGFTRIPAWVYTDPAVYKKEMDVFFAGDTWNYVGLECEVPEVGSFKRQWIGDRPVVIDFNVSRDAMVWPMVAAGVSNDDIQYARGISPAWDRED